VLSHLSPLACSIYRDREIPFDLDTGEHFRAYHQRLIEVAERDKKPVDELRALRHSASK
jgi:hypothetical protein